MTPHLSSNAAQSFIYRKSWKEIAAGIKEYWDQDYYITDFDYADGLYRVLLSKGTGWKAQAYRYGKDFPKEKVAELYDKNFYITNVTHDGSDWIVVMSKGTGLNGQTWFTRSSFTDFEKEIDAAWDKGKSITKVAYGDGMYLGVMSGGLGWSQSWWHWSKFPTDSLMKKKKTDGKIITDAFDFKSKVFTIASGNTGYRKQRFHKNKDWNKLDKLIDNRWAEGYRLTTVSYYKKEWILVFSK